MDLFIILNVTVVSQTYTYECVYQSLSNCILYNVCANFTWNNLFKTWLEGSICDVVSLLFTHDVTSGMLVFVRLTFFFCKVQEVLQPTSTSLSPKGNLLEGSLHTWWSPGRLLYHLSLLLWSQLSLFHHLQKRKATSFWVLCITRLITQRDAELTPCQFQAQV